VLLRERHVAPATALQVQLHRSQRDEARRAARAAEALSRLREERPADAPPLFPAGRISRLLTEAERASELTAAELADRMTPAVRVTLPQVLCVRREVDGAAGDGGGGAHDVDISVHALRYFNTIFMPTGQCACCTAHLPQSNLVLVSAAAVLQQHRLVRRQLLAVGAATW
jgi:hypothetical protein